jgi:hypothetical protein
MSEFDQHGYVVDDDAYDRNDCKIHPLYVNGGVHHVHVKNVDQYLKLHLN